MSDNEKLQNRCLALIMTIGLEILHELNQHACDNSKELAGPLIDALEAKEKEDK